MGMPTYGDIVLTAQRLAGRLAGAAVPGDRMRFSRELWQTAFDGEGHTAIVEIVEIRRERDGLVEIWLRKVAEQ